MSGEPDRAELLALARRMEAEGRGTEEVLEAFRARSASIVESMKVMRELKGISLGEAKDLVHYSETWRDLAPAHSHIHEQLIAGLREELPMSEDDGSYRLRVRLDEDS